MIFMKTLQISPASNNELSSEKYNLRKIMYIRKLKMIPRSESYSCFRFV